MAKITQSTTLTLSTQLQMAIAKIKVYRMLKNESTTFTSIIEDAILVMAEKISQDEITELMVNKYEVVKI